MDDTLLPWPLYNIYNNRAKLVNHGPMTIAIKRVYDPPAGKDGMRVLVDRLWPRGLTKERAAIDEWLRDLAPSDELRHWYHAHADQWEGFRQRYLKELAQADREEPLRRLYELAHGKNKRLTLLFASKMETHNNASVLKELLEGRRKPPTGTGPGAAYTLRRRAAAVHRR